MNGRRYGRRFGALLTVLLSSADALAEADPSTTSEASEGAPPTVSLVDAVNRATAAHQAASQPMTRLSTAEQALGNVDRYKASAQTEIYFDPGQSVLSKKAKNALDQMAATLKDRRRYVIEVHGYSAGHGQAAIANSQKIADSVVRYLVLSHRIRSRPYLYDHLQCANQFSHRQVEA